MHKIIKGQEAVCPDGLGRVVDYGEGAAGSKWIKVDTYVGNRGCKWGAVNVQLVEINLIAPLSEAANILNVYSHYKDILLVANCKAIKIIGAGEVVVYHFKDGSILNRVGIEYQVDDGSSKNDQV